MGKAILSAKTSLKCRKSRRYLRDVLVKKADSANSYNAMLGVLILRSYIEKESHINVSWIYLHFCDKTDFVSVVKI